MPSKSLIEELNLNDLEHVRDNVTSLIQKCVEKLEAKEIQLCDVVEGLGSLLTNINPGERALGTQILVNILQLLQISRVNTNELKFLDTFFIDRLKDHHTVVPHVIVGILVLVKHQSISSEDVISFLRTIFTEVHCQSQVLADRRNIYNLLQFCILHKEKEIKEMKDEFVLGFISAVEGEKDPRNLVLIFSLIPQITSKCLLQNFAEDLFEVVAAYFPIEFVAPRKGPFLVTTEDLVIGLRGCLSSTDAFAPFCIPLLEEKINSDVTSAKIESFLTLQACFKTYSPSSIRPHAFQLWNCIQREAMEGQNEKLKNEAQNTIGSMIEALDKEVFVKSIRDILTQIGSSAINACAQYLEYPEHHLIFPSSDVLLAVSSCSLLSFEICNKVLPRLSSLYFEKKESVARKNTLTIMARFLKRGAKYDIFKNEPSSLMRNECFSALLDGCKTEDRNVKEAAISSIEAATLAFTKAQNEEVSTLLAIMLCSQECWNTLKEPLSNSISCLGRMHPSTFESHIFIEIFNALQENKSFAQSEKGCHILDLIATLSGPPEVFQKVVPILWGKFKELYELNNFAAIHYVSCVRKTLERSADRDACVKYFEKNIDGFLRLQLLISDIILNAEPCVSDPVPVLGELSVLCCIFLNENKLETLKSFVKVLLSEENSEDLNKCLFSSASFPASSLTALENELQALLVYSIDPLFKCDRLISEIEDLERIASRIRTWHAASSDQRVREDLLITFASYILRIPTDFRLASFLSSLEVEFSDELYNEVNTDITAPSIQFLGWIVKSLIMRAYSKDLVWIKKVESLLLNPEHGEEASKIYVFLLKDFSSLTPLEAQPKNLKLLYKQRFFERRIEPLVEQFQRSDGKGKSNTLLAISHLLPCLPQTVLKLHMKKLLPILNQSMKTSDSTVTSGAVETLSALLKQDNDDIKLYVSDLVTPLISLSTTSSINVRVKSLECLESMAALPPTLTVPLKQEIVSGLKSALDDRKRVVRRAAASARSAWVLV